MGGGLYILMKIVFNYDPSAGMSFKIPKEGHKPYLTKLLPLKYRWVLWNIWNLSATKKKK